MRSIYLLLLAIVLSFVAVPATSQAQSDVCFKDVPGISDCIEGRFREYWEQNGGLAVFGYPISSAAQQTSNEGTFLTQTFERNSFELHPEIARPYDVLLGRLGDVRLQQQGRDWTSFPKGKRDDKCLWFSETGHSVCEPFKSYWESHGLQDPSIDAYSRSLALFGLPLSEPAMETNAAGANVMTQWFERGRFEYHPNNVPDYRVLLGLLGRETTTGGGAMPTPTPQPGAQCANIETPTDMIIDPNCVQFGGVIEIAAYGWDMAQPLRYRIVDQKGVQVGAIQNAVSDDVGFFRTTIDTRNWFGNELKAGDYTFIVSDGRDSNPGGLLDDSIGPFRVLP